VKKLTKEKQKKEAYEIFRLIKKPADQAFEVIADPIRKEYQSKIDPALKAYNSIVDLAVKVLEARLREIDEQDIKIIDGKKYMLMKEEV